MRVLISAYACEPGKGSEPEVGWQRALHMLAFAEQVWVLTRANNQAVIEANPLSRLQGLHFLYYDLPPWALKMKKRAWLLPVYLVLWQWGAYRLAAKHHRERPFDCVYHVTFVSMIWGSHMGRLGVPFVIGPVAGGERAPLRLRRGLPLRGKASELVRDLGILLQRYSPLSRSPFRAAQRIYVTTADSMRLVPKKWHDKTAVQLAVAWQGQALQRDEHRCPDVPRFVFAGRLLHWKGVHLAIRALAETRRTIPNATLTLIGDGPAEAWLRAQAQQCGVADAVVFQGRVPRQQLVDSLPAFTALVFPSLHDSGGFVVLEALSNGIPVACLDLGGPGIIVNESCGIVVPTKNVDEALAAAGLAGAMIRLASMPAKEWERLSKGAQSRAIQLSWDALTKRIVAEGSDLRRHRGDVPLPRKPL